MIENPWHFFGQNTQVYSVPASMLEQTIEKMEEVKGVGQELKKEEAKNIVLTVLGAVFMVVPFIGELGALAAGLNGLARIIGIVGIGVNTGWELMMLLNIQRFLL
jgi:hypothetical protein